MRANLKRELHDATSEFSDVVAALTGPHVGTLSKADHAGLMAKAEAAGLTSNNARVAMQMHRNVHGC